MDHAIADITRHQHGLVTLEQLDGLQVTRRQRQWRVRTGRWETPYTGIYRIGGLPPSWRSDLLAACLAGQAVASHRAAAAVWDLPGARRDRAEVIAKRWERAQHEALIVHESIVLDDSDKTEHGGIPVTTVERTLFDLASCTSDVVVDMAIDRATARGLIDHPRLLAAEARLAKRGRPGAARFHRVMASRSESTATPESAPERLLAHLLVGEGLPAPELQYVVRDTDGRFVARCDLAYPQWRIVVEYDSVQEHTGRQALVRDSARRNALLAVGFTPVTATVADLRNQGVRVASVIRQIRDRV